MAASSISIYFNADGALECTLTGPITLEDLNTLFQNADQLTTLKCYRLYLHYTVAPRFYVFFSGNTLLRNLYFFNNDISIYQWKKLGEAIEQVKKLRFLFFRVDKNYTPRFHDETIQTQIDGMYSVAAHMIERNTGPDEELFLDFDIDQDRFLELLPDFKENHRLKSVVVRFTPNHNRDVAQDVIDMLKENHTLVRFICPLKEASVAQINEIRLLLAKNAEETEDPGDEISFKNKKLNAVDVEIFHEYKDAIKIVHLEGCSIDDENMASFCVFFMNNPVLEELRLSYCDFTATQFRRLLVALEGAFALKTLYIEEVRLNPIDTIITAILPFIIDSKGFFSVLDLHFSVRGEDVGDLALALRSNTTLSEIRFLTAATINFDARNVFIEALKYNTTLTAITAPFMITPTDRHKTEQINLALANNKKRNSSLFALLKFQIDLAERREVVAKRSYRDAFNTSITDMRR